ncbi:hypothetical protein L1049_013463 [Liquidambar formosana]|uniref:MBD domain-containing protein n=1 Tax=Liquidambar formosana TaxID=63359 RepID=A0AAP0RQ30_LIQFO
MSISETSGQVPNPYSPQSEFAESDNIAGILADILPDPLLESGSFIDTNIGNGETLADADSNQGHAKRDTGHNHQMTEPVHDGAPDPVSDSLNCAEVATPVAVLENSPSPVEPRPLQGRAVESEKMGSELPLVPASSKTPDWLPEGWFVEDRVRSSGATAGMIDKYYVEAKSGRRFRSKKEVLYFLQTGTRRKRKTMGIPDVDTMSLASSGDSKRKKSGPRIKTFASNFDFVNAPEKIDWVLTDSPEGSWTPFISDEKVPESVKREWAAAFASRAVSNTGGGLF